MTFTTKQITHALFMAGFGTSTLILSCGNEGPQGPPGEPGENLIRPTLNLNSCSTDFTTTILSLNGTCDLLEGNTLIVVCFGVHDGGSASIANIHTASICTNNAWNATVSYDFNYFGIDGALLCQVTDDEFGIASPLLSINCE